MDEELELVIASCKEGMDDAIKHLEKQLLNIRAGKASPAMLGSVMVDYYGSQTPLAQVANVNTPDARTLSVTPWEKAMIPEIEKGITYANLGLNPMNNGESIIINVPALTEERRKNLAKQARAEGEEAKIGVRNDRKTAMNNLKTLEISEDQQKISENEIQEITNSFIKQIDTIVDAKEVEIMKV